MLTTKTNQTDAGHERRTRAVRHWGKWRWGRARRRIARAIQGVWVHVQTRSNLGKTWRCMHSVKLSYHQRAVWLEISVIWLINFSYPELLQWTHETHSWSIVTNSPILPRSGRSFCANLYPRTCSWVIKLIVLNSMAIAISYIGKYLGIAKSLAWDTSGPPSSLQIWILCS